MLSRTSTKTFINYILPCLALSVVSCFPLFKQIFNIKIGRQRNVDFDHILDDECTIRGIPCLAA